MKTITKILLVAAGLLLVAELVPGVTVDGIYPAIIAAIILGIFNVLVKPVLVVITLPVTVVTLGLFLLVINAGLFWFAASFLEGFAVSGFFSALVGSLIITMISSIGNRYIQ
ncbi:MAG: phage holin family protein [Patescibacteria group bacterium]